MSDGKAPSMAAAEIDNELLLRRLRRWPISQPPCQDCESEPFAYHQWNCPGTPIWAQTIRDLDINPWTITQWRPYADLAAMTIDVATFVWRGSVEHHCGRGPCCLGDGHDGRCAL